MMDNDIVFFRVYERGRVDADTWNKTTCSYNGYGTCLRMVQE